MILNDSPGSPTSWSRRWLGWWKLTSANGKPPLTILTAALFRTAVNVPAAEENKRWQEICNIDEIPEQAGIGAHLGRKPIALLWQNVYALDDREPGSRANVLSRGILGDAAGNRW